MVNLNLQQFQEKKKMGKIFPVYVQMNGDELTPVNIFYKQKGQYKFLLESASLKGEGGRYSFIGENPYLRLSSRGEAITIYKDKETFLAKGKVLDYAQKYLANSYEKGDLDIPFVGGAVGYVGYDVIRQYEKLPDENQDELKFICYDHFNHNVMIIHNVLPEDDESYEHIVDNLNETIATLVQEDIKHELKELKKGDKILSNFDKAEYCNIVDKAKNYIKAGDIFQVVLSQRLKIENVAAAFDVYRRLRRKNPSPYMFFIDFEEFQLVGSSPESLVTVENGKVSTNPIAGTRPRGLDAKEDELLKIQLLKDEKELAEHLMLVDLGRNDIGRISEFGSVKLDKFLGVDLFSHVMHIASKVSGSLKSEFSCFDALSSCLPVGTVSGAPKIRAMEIIDELENARRGIYSGAVGHFSYDGNMDTCIAIRTIILKDNFAYVQAGAGIVYDSVPEKEYEETLNKSMALREVL
jgi:anthranilate synthase component 1